MNLLFIDYIIIFLIVACVIYNIRDALRDNKTQKMSRLSFGDGIFIYYNQYVGDNKLTIFDSSQNISGRVSIPSVVKYKGRPYTVTKIMSAFEGRGDINSVVMPAGVLEIGANSFKDCTALSQVELPPDLNIMGEECFAGCVSLKAIFLPERLKIIGQRAFQGCESLTSVMIPRDVTEIGFCAFASCKSLTAIDVVEGNTIFSSQDGVLFNKEKTELIQFPSNSPMKDYTIPDTVTTISEFAFGGCSQLQSVTIPESVMSIEKFTIFSGCNSLRDIYFRSSVPPHIYSNESGLVFAENQCTLHVPQGSIDAYKGHATWRKFKDVVPTT